MRRSNRPAGIEVDVRNLYAHDTAEVLSQKIPMCDSSMGTPDDSNASQFRAIPASSRSLIVSVPVGFLSVMSDC